MKARFDRVILAIVTLAIVLVTLSGAALTFIAVTSPSAVEVTIGHSNVSLSVATSIPSVIVFVVGASALVLLLIKVPVKVILVPDLLKESGTTRTKLRNEQDSVEDVELGKVETATIRLPLLYRIFHPLMTRRK